MSLPPPSTFDFRKMSTFDFRGTRLRNLLESASDLCHYFDSSNDNIFFLIIWRQAQ
jgi:hypothetical protein